MFLSSFPSFTLCLKIVTAPAGGQEADPRPAVELEVKPQPSEELIFHHSIAQGTLEHK